MNKHNMNVLSRNLYFYNLIQTFLTFAFLFSVFEETFVVSESTEACFSHRDSSYVN